MNWQAGRSLGSVPGSDWRRAPSGPRRGRNYLPPAAGLALEAVSCIDSVVPSGSLNAKLTLSPLLGLVAPRSTETAGGVPVGPVTVAPVSEDEIALSFRPNGEPATSSATLTEVSVGEVMTRRPRP